MAQPQRKTIRLEDLGEPVQNLLKKIKGGVTDEDMALFEYVAVKDMVKIYNEMNSDKGSEEIWEELRAQLMARKEKAARKERELREKEHALQEALDQEQSDAQRAQDDEAAAEEAARLAEEKRQRKAEKRRRKAEEAKAAAEAEEQARIQEEYEAAEAAAKEEEEQRLAEEEAQRERREAKKRRKAEKLKRLQEEQDQLAKAKDEEEQSRKKDIKKEWEEYKAAHPLEFSNNEPQVIEQKKRHEHDDPTKAPPKASEDLLTRTYTPQCPNCHAKYSKAPPEWNCGMCLRKFRQQIKCWQPDESAPNCGVCKTGVGRFSRHHCRNCGRVVCGKCSEFKAKIPALGYKDPVKVCKQCVDQSLGAPQ